MIENHEWEGVDINSLDEKQLNRYIYRLDKLVCRARHIRFEKYDTPLMDLDLGVKIYNILRNGRGHTPIYTVEQLVEHIKNPRVNLLHRRGFGKRSKDIVIAKLKDRGLI